MKTFERRFFKRGRGVVSSGVETVSLKRAKRMTRIAVVGGGLAGISAAWEAKKRGFDVVLFERRRHLGGRAASFEQGTTRDLLDNGRRVFLGCCSEQRKLQSELGLSDCFDRFDRIPFAFRDKTTFLRPNRVEYLQATSWLPKSLQFLPSFASLSFLTTATRLKIVWDLLFLSRPLKSRYLNDSFADWLKRRRATTNSVELFWKPLIWSSFSETLENVSVAAVGVLVRRSFSAGGEGTSLWLPNRPLREIYHSRTLTRLAESGIEIRRSVSVRRIRVADGRFVGLRWSRIRLQDDFPNNSNSSNDFSVDERDESFDGCVLAVDFASAKSILTESNLGDFVRSLDFDRFESGAITAVHLWFDRPIFDDFAAVLTDGPGQWLFCPSNQNANGRLASFHRDVPIKRSDSERVDSDGTNRDESKNVDRSNRNASENASLFYCQVLISASHRLLSPRLGTESEQEKLVRRISEQLNRFFPEARTARLIRFQIATVRNAVVSPTPTVYSSRPPQKTGIIRFALAGDWTASEFPSTLEGAIRAGQAAVRALSDDERRSFPPDEDSRNNSPSVVPTPTESK